MAKTTSKKISAKASVSKPLVKPPPVDKTLGLGPVIRLYTIEESDDTAPGEEVETIFAHN